MRDFLQGQNFVKGVKLSFVCLILLIPNILWGYNKTYVERVKEMLEPGNVVPRMVADIFFIWVAMQISATAGYAWAKRPWLAGTGTWGELKKNLWLAVLLGIGIAAVETVVFDKWLLRPLFDMFGKNPFMSGRYVAEELIFRFGIMSIAFRLTQSTPMAVGISAVFNIVLALEGSLSTDVVLPTGLLAIALAKGTALAVFFGWFCAKKGLFADMALRFIIGLKFAIYAFAAF